MAIRGSIWLRFRNPFSAASDFWKMLQTHEQNNATKEQIADAMVHLGFAYVFCFRGADGIDYLKRGIQDLNPNHAAIVRAKHKLAIAYERAGKRIEYDRTGVKPMPTPFVSARLTKSDSHKKKLEAFPPRKPF